MDSLKINIINKQFDAFSKKALKKADTDTRFLITQMQLQETNYRQAGAVELFIYKAQQFAEQCLNAGLSNFTGIIYSSLIKFEPLPFELKEVLIKRSLEIAKINDDPIHQLARIVDLKHLYTKNPNVDRKKYIKILFSEEDILKKIVRNFEECSEKFRTVVKEESEFEKYKFHLGLIKMEIARIIMKTDKKLALKELKTAKNIFAQLGKTKEEYTVYGFIEKLTR